MEPEIKEIYPELKKIEDEIQVLKILVVKSRKLPIKRVSLEGMLVGVKVEERDIEKAKRAIFKFSA